MIRKILLIFLLPLCLKADEIETLKTQLENKISNRQRVEIYLKLGDLSVERGYLFDALNYYNSALNLSRTTKLTLTSYVKLSDTYHKLGNLARAIEFINQAIKIKPREIFLIKKLAMLYEESDMPELAIKQYTKILNLQNDIETHEKLADIYRKKGLYASAIPHYKVAVQANPAGHLLHKLSVCYENIGEISLAESTLKELLWQNPNYEGYIYLGKHYYKQGNFEKAAEAFSNAMLFAPQKEEALMYAGISFYKNGRLKESEEIFKILLKRNSRSSLAYLFLGLIHQKYGHKADSKIFLKKAQDITNNNLLKKYITYLTFN